MKNSLSSYTLPSGNVQDKWDDFATNLTDLLETHIPQKASSAPKAKPWITRELKTLLHRQFRAFNKWKKKPTEDTHNKYKAPGARTVGDHMGHELQNAAYSGSQERNKRYYYHTY